MTNWTIVFWYELMQQLRRKSFWLTTLGIPLIFWLILGGYLGYQELRKNEPEQPKDEFEGENTIGYFDETDFFAAPEPNSPFASLVKPYVTLGDGEQALEKGEIDLLYIIEADYFETGDVTVLLREITMDVFEHSLMDAFIINSLAQQLDPQMVVRMRYPILDVNEQKLAKDGTAAEVSNTEVNFLVVYLFALALMMTTFIASGYLMQSVATEKQNQVIEILLTSVKPFPLLLGKTLAMGLVGLLQMLIWAVAAFGLLTAASQNIPGLSLLDVQPSTIVIALLYFLLAYGVVGSVFAAMGALVTNTQDASQLVGWIVLPFILPLFFTASFVNSPDGTLARVLSLIPFTSPMAMLMRASAASVPLWEIILSAGLTFLLMLGCIWLAGRMFRVGTLLRGTPPKLRDLPRLIFEA